MDANLAVNYLRLSDGNQKVHAPTQSRRLRGAAEDGPLLNLKLGNGAVDSPNIS